MFLPSPMKINESNEIDVRSYAGYRGSEKPLEFISNGVLHRVHALLDSSLRQDVDTGKRFHFYRVLTEEHLEFTLIHSLSTLAWYLIDQSG